MDDEYLDAVLSEYSEGYDYDDDDDDVGYAEIGYADEVGAICDATGWAPEEVGRLFKSKKKRRRFLGSLFGGPAGALGALIKRRKDKKKKKRMSSNSLARSLQAANLSRQVALMAPKAPRTLPSSIMPGYGRSVPLGLGQSAILASGVATLTAVAQRPMQPHRVVVGAGNPGLIQITDIKIGVKSQLAGIEGIPAGAFLGTAEEIGVEFDPVQTGVTVSIEFVNLDAVNPDVVQASLFGKTSEN